MSHNQLLDQQDASLRPFALRGTDRALARLQQRAALEMARIGETAVTQVARVEAVACVGRRAMFETALLTQAEQSLAQLVPLAASRLQAIGDIATLGMAEVVSDTVRKVTR